ncbi:MAG: C25 family cysteine peptidase [Candidatus Krumholzibacteriota bacterium]|nr:C25 family cysteine peptidase [Candidatus Krumholzibacteriota bacterium]
MKLKHLAIICAAAFLLAGNALAKELSKNFQFSKPQIVRVSNGVILKLDGCGRTSEPGKPVIPVYRACFLLPPGETLSEIIIESEEYTLLNDSLRIAPAPYQKPIGFSSYKVPGKDKSVYALNTLYPEEKGKFVTEQIISGIHLVFVNIYPCRIIPSTGSVSYTNSVRVTVETKFINKPQPVHPQRAVSTARDKISRFIDNKEDLTVETKAIQSEGVYGDEIRFPYIIITSNELSEYFQPLADLKTDMGLKANIVTLDWIHSSFVGIDTQEKIRNFISHAYFNWEAEYILLGGDDELIPHRGLYVNAGSEIEPDIPSDLYYAALDGNWNSDGDQYYGEPGEEDLIPEVTLGRLPVNNQADIENFIAKLIAYTLQPQSEQCIKSLMLGELLWSEDSVDTWGGDYKNEVLSGSNNFDLETAGLSENFNCQTLYDKDLPLPWNETDLIPLFNGGVNLVNHLGHTGLHNAMHITENTITLLENNGTEAIPSVIYSQGCYTSAFDNRDYVGTTYSEDAIAEQFITSNGGAVAFIGNTRFGWNAPGSTCGVSQFFDRQFFDALFGESIKTIGRAFDKSRIDNIPYITYPLFRYVMYEMCLLGDPAMMIWTSEPSELSVLYDSTVPPGNNNITIETRSGFNPVSGSFVSIYKTGSNLYETAFTDKNGIAVLSPSISDTGFVQLRVKSADHYLYRDSILIDQTPDALAELEGIHIDDNSLGESFGDGDGIVESGERISIGITVSNQGSSAINDCHVTLSCNAPFTWNIDSLSDTFSLPERTCIILEKEFLIEFSTDVQDGYTVELDFNISSSDREWNSRRLLTVSSPVIKLESWATSDTLLGNGNGCVEAWEFINLTSFWTNKGSVDIPPSVLTLSMPDLENARPYKDRTELPSIPTGSTVTSNNSLSFFVKPEAPPFFEFPIILKLEKENFASHSETLLVTTCGHMIDDPVDSVSFFDHRAIVGVDGWHISGSESYSSPNSWKCGAATPEDYPNMMEAVLVSPPLCLGENSQLSFRHKIDAEAESVYPYWAEDGGIVEITTDGGDSWTAISPVYNYPCRASGSNTIFLDPYQRCYSGRTGWEYQEFDLSAFSGQVMIRFHFASNEQYGFEGWYIDDINISTERYTDIDDGEEHPPILANSLYPAYPNPFNPTTVIPFEVAEKSPVTMRIYDVSGRSIRTLVNKILPEGKHQTVWDGKDKTGRNAASNIYFCRLQIGSFTSTERLILLR